MVHCESEVVCCEGDAASDLQGHHRYRSIGHEIQNLMSCHQCYVCSHNRKGRCPENIKGERICECYTGYPSSRESCYHSIIIRKCWMK